MVNLGIISHLIQVPLARPDLILQLIYLFDPVDLALAPVNNHPVPGQLFLTPLYDIIYPYSDKLSITALYLKPRSQFPFSVNHAIILICFIYTFMDLTL